MSINPNRDISVLWVAESNWVTNSGLKPHKHDYYHMFIVRQGPLDFIFDDEYCIGIHYSSRLNGTRNKNCRQGWHS